MAQKKAQEKNLQTFFNPIFFVDRGKMKLMAKKNK